MMNRGILKLVKGIALFCICQSSMAALLDFTDNAQIGSLTAITNGYSGSIDGIGFTLTSTDGTVNFNEDYDGTLFTGCQSGSGPLKCNRDATGIDNDEITSITATQKLTLKFDSVVEISALYFLDLYVRTDGSGDKEQATITFDGGFTQTADALESPGQGGYVALLFSDSPILAQTLEFTGAIGSQFWDDKSNDYAFAGAHVTATPIPAAVWLFGSALGGLIGFRRVKKA